MSKAGGWNDTTKRQEKRAEKGHTSCTECMQGRAGSRTVRISCNQPHDQLRPAESAGSVHAPNWLTNSRQSAGDRFPPGRFRCRTFRFESLSAGRKSSRRRLVVKATGPLGREHSGSLVTWPDFGAFDPLFRLTLAGLLPGILRETSGSLRAPLTGLLWTSAWRCFWTRGEWFRDRGPQ